MDKNAIWKWLILLVLIIGSLWLVLPLEKKVRFGLDIVGGMSMTVQIDEQAIEAMIREEKARDDQKELTPEEIQSLLPGKIKEAQGRALEVIRNRVDTLGISEPVIYPEKFNRIVVQLPGIDERKRAEAIRMIKEAAFLEFRLVVEDNQEKVQKLFEKAKAPPGYKIYQSAKGDYFVRDESVSNEELDELTEKILRFQAPHRADLLLEKETIDGRTCYRPWFVEQKRRLTGERLKRAYVSPGNLNQPLVEIEMDAKGRDMFRKVTTDYVNHHLAIVLDGKLHSAPVIEEPIPNGRAIIRGNFDYREAAFLANILKAGSLPAPMKIVESRVVDPTLGKDAVDSGLRAGIYGIVAILLLMALYYLISGLLADLALILNIVLLPLGMYAVAGFLGLFSGEARAGSAVALPVLTLPGIAGIVLAIGMAVDANVLIFERIREEIAVGKGFSGAILAGFQRAFSAICDSNVTTIITAIILFILGTGPVRGYAVTLCAGLLVSMYTAIVVTRMCFNLIGSRTSKLAVLKMFSIIRATNFDFIKPWKIALSISVAVILISWGLMVAHGRQDRSRVFSVEFTGGSALTMGFQSDQKPNVEDIREKLEASGIGDATIQYQKEMRVGGSEYLQVKMAGNNKGEIAEKALIEGFPAAKFKMLAQDDVGPQVGSELKTKAMWAMFWSLVAMVIYLWWRFELGFGFGAVVAVFHDVLVTAGICHLMGFQMSMTLMAALLTIVGYSVNDTIVIFDRIRENLRMVRNKSFMEVCNLSMNQTLGRTLLTNFLTFVSVMFLLIFGGGAIRDFAAAMFIGMISGTYSTVYIATPIMLMYYRYKTPDLGRVAKV